MTEGIGCPIAMAALRAEVENAAVLTMARCIIMSCVVIACDYSSLSLPLLEMSRSFFVGGFFLGNLGGNGKLSRGAVLAHISLFLTPLRIEFHRTFSVCTRHLLVLQLAPLLCLPRPPRILVRFQGEVLQPKFSKFGVTHS